MDNPERIISINNWPDMLTLPALAVSLSAFGAIFLVPGRAQVAFWFGVGALLVFAVSFKSAIARIANILAATLLGLPLRTRREVQVAVLVLRALHGEYPDLMRAATGALLEGLTLRRYLSGVSAADLAEEVRGQVDPTELRVIVRAAQAERARISG